MLLWQMQLSRPEGCTDSVATPSLQDGERGRWGLSGVLRSPSGWRLNLKKYYILIPGLRGTPRDSASWGERSIFMRSVGRLTPHGTDAARVGTDAARVETDVARFGTDAARDGTKRVGTDAARSPHGTGLGLRVVGI